MSRVVVIVVVDVLLPMVYDSLLLLLPPKVPLPMLLLVSDMRYSDCDVAVEVQLDVVARRTHSTHLEWRVPPFLGIVSWLTQRYIVRYDCRVLKNVPHVRVSHPQCFVPLTTFQIAIVSAYILVM